jgi:hypothetical protein
LDSGRQAAACAARTLQELARRRDNASQLSAPLKADNGCLSLYSGDARLV